LKAAALYKQWISEVAENWEALGIGKLPGRGCKWRADVGDKLLLLFVEINPKYPWTVYGGGDFSINAYLPRETPSDPSKYTEDIFDGVSFFHYWSNVHTELRYDANRNVFEKLKNLDKATLYSDMATQYDCTPEDARDLQFHETALEIMQMDVDEPSEAHVNPPLYFYDADDISMWADIVSQALPGVLRGVRDNPRYSFTDDN
jgi:hypothetical protein